MQQINIPTPCHENWDVMNPTQQGRHCNQCSKTVVDFTTWQKHDIFSYLNKNKEEHVCGRFTQTQLEEKMPTAEQFAKQISYFRISTLKKVAAIFLFVFGIAGTACNERLTGVVVANSLIEKPTTQNLGEPVLIGDTIISTTVDTIKKHPTKGRVVISTINKRTECVKPKVMGKIDPAFIKQSKDVKIEQQIMGDIEVINTSPTQLSVIKKPIEPVLMGKPSIENIIKTDTLKSKF